MNSTSPHPPEGGSPGKQLRVLILEDRQADAELELRELRKEGIECTALRVETENDFRRQLREYHPRLILADYGLPDYDGLSALAVATKECPDVPFILVSGTLGEEAAIESLKHGAADYVLKQRLQRLGPAVRRALHEADERNELKQVHASLTEQLAELRRWQHAMLGRETRVIELKQEVNVLLARLGEPPRYESVERKAESSSHEPWPNQ